MPEPGYIRRASSSDLDKIIELERKCFPNEIAYSPNQLNYLITRANGQSLTETSEDVLRGLIIVLYRRGTTVAGIETLNVDPMFQGKGIAKRLLIAAEEEMHPLGIKKIRLEVSTTNHPALNLYEKMGYEKILFLKNYYQLKHNGTRDAFRMIKELT